MTDDGLDAPDGAIVLGWERSLDEWMPACPHESLAVQEIIDLDSVDGRAPLQLQDGHPSPSWPLPNVWIGASVEDQATADERIPALRKVPAAVRFLSCEPLLGPVQVMPSEGDGAWLKARDDCRLLHRDEPETSRTGGTWSFGGGIDWVICGGESGPKARPMHPDWARSLRDQCVAAGVPFFFKQWGEFGTIESSGVHLHEWTHMMTKDGLVVRRGDDCTPGFAARSAFMVKAGKKAAGRELDGRTWDEMPEVE